MLFIFISFFSISLILLISLKFLQKRFDPFEIFILFMFNSYQCQNFFYLLSSPYDRLRVVEEHLPFWTVRLQYGIIFPALLMWVMYALRSDLKFSIKIMICFSWVAGGVLIEKILLLIGVLASHSKSWYPSIDFVMSMIVLSICILFMELLPPILRKEKVIP
ncbi:hypothetical protein DYI25_18615 [Mesobacillus boroniphilus]|uniref:Uncharacterized protein n=1 Tax=Mesobacillus boroniphilus TaxID=308892 RepID=A0A944GY03_9BACI|nr:hypothetical protein [Mesobacillus boroniphilus]